MIPGPLHMLLAWRGLFPRLMLAKGWFSALVKMFLHWRVSSHHTDLPCFQNLHEQVCLGCGHRKLRDS